jgi:DNA-binding NarL/FixJ family response regulator
MRIWVVDDQREVREGVTELIERRVPAARVTGQFARGSEVLKALDGGRAFEVALVDLGLPDMQGEEVIRHLRSCRPPAAIIAFTIRFDEEAVFSALRAGASGYVTKEASDQTIVDAIVSGASGAAPFSPEVSRCVAKSFWASSQAHRRTTVAQPSAALTPREREVLDLVCTGASYREVGQALGISLGTIQTHIKSIYGKLGVANKAEAVRWVLGAPSSSR